MTVGMGSFNPGHAPRFHPFLHSAPQQGHRWHTIYLLHDGYVGDERLGCLEGRHFPMLSNAVVIGTCTHPICASNADGRALLPLHLYVSRPGSSFLYNATPYGVLFQSLTSLTIQLQGPCILEHPRRMYLASQPAHYHHQLATRIDDAAWIARAFHCPELHSMATSVLSEAVPVYRRGTARHVVSRVCC